MPVSEAAIRQVGNQVPDIPDIPVFIFDLDQGTIVDGHGAQKYKFQPGDATHDDIAPTVQDALTQMAMMGASDVLKPNDLIPEAPRKSREHRRDTAIRIAKSFIMRFRDETTPARTKYIRRVSPFAVASALKRDTGGRNNFRLKCR